MVSERLMSDSNIARSDVSSFARSFDRCLSGEPVDPVDLIYKVDKAYALPRDEMILRRFFADAVEFFSALCEPAFDVLVVRRLSEGERVSDSEQAALRRMALQRIDQGCSSSEESLYRSSLFAVGDYTDDHLFDLLSHFFSLVDERHMDRVVGLAAARFFS